MRRAVSSRPWATKLAGIAARNVTSGAINSGAAQKFPFPHSARTGRSNSSFSSDIAHAVSPGVGEVASLPPAPEKPRRSGLREAEKGDYHDHKRDDQDDAEGVHLPR